MKLKKLNLVIGKRQIIIVSLLITLSVAAFLNWQFATTDQSVTVMDVSDKTTKDNENKIHTYGEAELVNKNTTNYIKQMRLNMDTSYEETMEKNNNILKDTNLSQEKKDEIINNNLKLSENRNISQQIDADLRANKSTNVKDSITYIKDDQNNKKQMINVCLIPLTKKLEDNNIAAIKDTIVSLTGASASDITITPVDNESKLYSK